MKQIDVRPYTVEVKTTEGQKVVPYDVKASLVHLLFASEKLNAVETLKRHAIGNTIRAAEGTLLVEEADYAVIRQSVDAHVGWAERDVEFIQRVFDAKTVDVVVKE